MVSSQSRLRSARGQIRYSERTLVLRSAKGCLLVRGSAGRGRWRRAGDRQSAWPGHHRDQMRWSTSAARLRW